MSTQSFSESKIETETFSCEQKISRSKNQDKAVNNVHWTFITYTRFLCTPENPLYLIKISVNLG